MLEQVPQANKVKMPISLVSIFNIEPPADATANANLQFNSSTGRAEWVSASSYSFQGSVSGYTSGGLVPPATNANTVDKFPFTTDANATDVGDLTQARQQVAGQSSTVSGYTSGGIPGPLNTIDKFPFASNANASDVGDLSLARGRSVGQSSTASGYTSGGQTPGDVSVNTIDKFPFASDGNASDVGDLTQSRYGLAGQQV